MPYTAPGYPVQIQADNDNADNSMCACMCHVFDVNGLITIRDALQKQYRHVVAWDANGNTVCLYDNR